ncbi:hypothetical protein [Klebsiella aerogenes]|uniref:hypothetical protein n=1 Tax=Klebsiella aerogenes TaxID=548 RepID=UPI0037BD814D
MEPIYVSFTDATHEVINGALGGVQPIESFPYQGIVYANDPRYITWYDTLPWWSQTYLPDPIRS